MLLTGTSFIVNALKNKQPNVSNIYTTTTTTTTATTTTTTTTMYEDSNLCSSEFFSRLI